MFKVLSGVTEEPNVPWLNGKVSEGFIRRARVEWFEDQIVKDELRVVEHIVEPTFPMFKKESGVLIPPHWLGQGTRQFLYMTKIPKGIFDSFYFGVNVYPFFCRWANEKGVDVVVKINSRDVWEYKELSGLYLNTREYFNNGDELYELIVNNRQTLLKSYNNGVITAQKFITINDISKFVGAEFKIKVK